MSGSLTWRARTSTTFSEDASLVFMSRTGGPYTAHAAVRSRSIVVAENPWEPARASRASTAIVRFHLAVFVIMVAHAVRVSNEGVKGRGSRIAAGASVLYE